MITPHADGQSVDAAGLARNLLAVLRQPAPAAPGDCHAGTVDAEFTTEAANALGVTEQFSSFTANFVACGTTLGMSG